MIVGIGIDSVEIARFERWVTFDKQQLLRIFSSEEIVYALRTPIKSAERLAVRFAAREALYKALSPIVKKPLPFLTLCSACTVLTSPSPVLKIHFDYLSPFLSIKPPLKTHLSLSHSKKSALACVILER